MSNNAQPTTPDEQYIAFNKLAQGNINTQLILISVKLKLPKLLADGPKTLSGLTKETGSHGHTLARFLRGMCTLNLVNEVEPNVYEKGPFLDLVYSVQGPGFGETAYQSWEKSIHTVTTGKPAWDEVFGLSFYKYLDENPQISHSFDQWNANSAFFMELLTDQYPFERFKTLVDIGGGQGGFLINLLKKSPTMQGTLFDREETINNTLKSLKDANLETTLKSRLSTQPGSFFESVPQGADGYTICRVLLNWNDEQVVDILKTCRQSMTKDSKLVIVDFYIPQPDDPSYAFMVANDLNLLVNFGGGLRTKSQWCDLASAAGLAVEDFLTASSSPLFLMETCIEA